MSRTGNKMRREWEKKSGNRMRSEWENENRK
jgi:hypothetical protein